MNSAVEGDGFELNSGGTAAFVVCGQFAVDSLLEEAGFELSVPAM
jgi:hypothetical protein